MRASTITRQLVMRSKYLSSLSASSWTRAATAADASIFRKVVCTGRIMMVWSSFRFEKVTPHQVGFAAP